jgi:hypothetical protein
MTSLFLKERSIDDEYPGDILYICCTELSPTFEHFFVAVTKKIFHDFEEKIRSKLCSDDSVIRDEATTECLCTISGTTKTFDKCKRNVEELKRQAKNGDIEYKDFCNDVVIYYAYMRVLFHKPIPLIEHSQMMKIRNIMEEKQRRERSDM